MQFTINNRANFLEVWWCYFTKGRPFMFCAFSIRLDIKLDNENVRDMRKVHCRYQEKKQGVKKILSATSRGRKCDVLHDIPVLCLWWKSSKKLWRSSFFSKVLDNSSAELIRMTTFIFMFQGFSSGEKLRKANFESSSNERDLLIYANTI